VSWLHADDTIANSALAEQDLLAFVVKNLDADVAGNQTSVPI
jgi:hypothetical protein